MVHEFYLIMYKSASQKQWYHSCGFRHIEKATNYVETVTKQQLGTNGLQFKFEKITTYFSLFFNHSDLVQENISQESIVIY